MRSALLLIALAACGSDHAAPQPIRFLHTFGAEETEVFNALMAERGIAVDASRVPFARDQQVPRAFSAISAQCAAHVPFPLLGYREFIWRMGAVIERHGNLGVPEKVVLRTWKRGARARLEQPPKRGSAWFRPVLPGVAR